jgi:hypothetical protein
MQDVDISIPKRPTEYTYTGYGKSAGFFFYYGNMNESAFHAKFLAKDKQNNGIPDELDLDSLPPDEDVPNMDLQFDVEVHCPLELAPLEYLEKYHSPDVELRYSRMMKLSETLLSTKSGDHGSRFFLQMNIYCPTSFKNRLPYLFHWVIKSSDFDKTISPTPPFINDDYCSVPVSSNPQTDDPPSPTPEGIQLTEN